MATLTEPNSFYKESVCNCLKNGFNAIISGKNCFAQNASALAHGAKNPAFTPTLPRLFVVATRFLVIGKAPSSPTSIISNVIIKDNDLVPEITSSNIFKFYYIISHNRIGSNIITPPNHFLTRNYVSYKREIIATRSHKTSDKKRADFSAGSLC